jgi:hypothetical protein
MNGCRNKSKYGTLGLLSQAADESINQSVNREHQTKQNSPDLINASSSETVSNAG